MYRTLIYTIAFTGMHPGEAIALKLEDIDLDKKIININKPVYAKKAFVANSISHHQKLLAASVPLILMIL